MANGLLTQECDVYGDISRCKKILLRETKGQYRACEGVETMGVCREAQ